MDLAKGTLEIKALGRPFQLGMLYDNRKDAIVPGITLWDREKLQENTVVSPHHNTEFKITTSDTIHEKATNLEVTGELKLSLLAGLFTVSGAARYFKDKKKSFIQERLTLHYKTNVRFEQLSMNHLAQEKLAHHEVFDHDTATHVVTGLEYGANAYFVFDREVSLDEDKKDVVGEVKIAFEKLKSFDVGGTVSLTIDESEKNVLKKFKCTFHGDFKLPSNPTTFEDAVKVYADLPNMLGEKGEHAVPLKVYLYPLVKLKSGSETEVQRRITTGIIRDLESVIETLNETEMKCNDLMEDTVAKSFSSFHSRLQAFQKLCTNYKLEFMSEFGSLLPAIRGGKKEINVLTDLLLKHEKSPFSKKDLQQWMSVKKKESNVVRTLLKQLFEFGADVCEDIETYLLDRSVNNVLSYAFTSLQQPDPHLIKLEYYLKSSNNQEVSEENKTLQDGTWVTSDLVSMRNHLYIFEKLVTCKNQSTKFIVQSLSPTSELSSGSCILVYESGCEKATSFTPPSKPPTPVTEGFTCNSIRVNLGPSCPATLKRNLLYKMNREMEWKSQHVDQDVVTLKDLQDGSSYEIKCEAVGKLNYSVESDVVTAHTMRDTPHTHKLRLKLVRAESKRTKCIKLNEICFGAEAQDDKHNVTTSSEAIQDYHLLVIAEDESTEERTRKVNEMEEVFGKECWRNTVVIFTNCEDGQSEIQNIMAHVDICEISFLHLDSYENINSSRVLELLNKVDYGVKEKKQEAIDARFVALKKQIQVIEKELNKPGAFEMFGEICKKM